MLKKIIFILLSLFLFGIVVLLSINTGIILTGKKHIIDYKQTDVKADCILVLGASVRPDQTPSPMLEDRILQGVDVYNEGLAPKIIMSGDHVSNDYDEVSIMKKYAVNLGVPSTDIFLDHLGINTYNSIYRAKYLFKAKKIIIITQEYHLYRALYIARELGLEAYGVPSDRRKYAFQFKRDIREMAARIKAIISTNIKKETPYKGESVDLNSNGDLTN